MAVPAIKVVSPAAVETNPFSRLTAAEEIIDTNISRLRIQSVLAKAGISVDVTNLVTTGTVTDSFTSAPQLQFDCLDRDYKALNSGIFDDVVEIKLDDVPYRLVEVSLTDTETLELTWEHKIVALLRQHKKFLSVQRGAVTRAQFIEMLLREILADFGEIVYVCPEINVTQPVAAPRTTGRSLVSKKLAAKTTTRSTRTSTFGASSMQIRDWDGTMVTLSRTQLDNAAIVLQTCNQDGAGAKATLAAMEACLIEPSQPYENSPIATDHTSTGILQVLSSTASGLGINPLDIAQCVHAFLKRGFWGKGGAIALARNNPGWSAGQVAQNTQGSQIPARYDMAQQGAQAVINAYTASGGTVATGASAQAGVLAATKQYEFTRGRAGQTEDSYTCALRLAAEVQWRFFVAGRRSVYFVTDNDLLKSAAHYTISPDSQGVAKPTFNIEKGGRTIVVRRHRIPKPSEGQVAVRVSRLQASVGDVLNIKGYGPADDRWLLKQIDRDLFDKAGTLYFQSPQKALPEPAASVSTNVQPIAPGSASSSSANPIDRVYAAAQAMSARNLPYIAAGVPQGGHGGTWAQEAVAKGQDCSSSVSLVLYAAGLMAGYSGSIVSGQFNTWGQPGHGSQMTVWYTNGHVFIEFYGRPAKRFDTVGTPSGPHLRYQAPPEDMPLFAARHWAGF